MYVCGVWVEMLFVVCNWDLYNLLFRVLMGLWV